MFNKNLIKKKNTLMQSGYLGGRVLYSKEYIHTTLNHHQWVTPPPPENIFWLPPCPHQIKPRHMMLIFGFLGADALNTSRLLAKTWTEVNLRLYFTHHSIYELNIVRIKTRNKINRYIVGSMLL